MDSLKKLTKLYPNTHKLLQSYLNLDFGKVKVACPYWINNIKKGIRGPYSGKGTPAQIVSYTKKLAKSKSVDLTKINQKDIKIFLKQNRIGVDCSGFAYHLLDCLDREKGGNGIADNIFGQTKFPDWNPAWRASANLLTSEKVTRVVSLNEIKVGDVIRIDGGKHMLIIIDISLKSITYAHSSKRLTKIKGVHTQKIIISDKINGLGSQNWSEKTPEGDSFGKYFISQNGDSIRRFNWW